VTTLDGFAASRDAEGVLRPPLFPQLAAPGFWRSTSDRTHGADPRWSRTRTPAVARRPPCNGPHPPDGSSRDVRRVGSRRRSSVCAHRAPHSGRWLGQCLRRRLAAGRARPTTELDAVASRLPTVLRFALAPGSQRRRMRARGPRHSRYLRSDAENLRPSRLATCPLVSG